MKTQIAEELIEMARHDQQVREQLLNEGTLSERYNPEMEAVNKKNTIRLTEIVDEFGYPTKSKVGTEAS